MFTLNEMAAIFVIVITVVTEIILTINYLCSRGNGTLGFYDNKIPAPPSLKKKEEAKR